MPSLDSLAGLDRNPLCDNLWDPVGGFCRGPFEDLQPGQLVVFRYEYCPEEHEPDVAGAQICLSVNLNDGEGFRFITADARSTFEMYTHTETFSTSDPMCLPVLIPGRHCIGGTDLSRSAMRVPDPSVKSRPSPNAALAVSQSAQRLSPARRALRHS